MLLLEVTPEPKTLQQDYTAVSERLYARKLERGTLVAPFPMESASSLIDLTLPVAPSLSSRSHSRQHFMTPPAVTDTTHNEECGGSPSDGQLKRGGVGSPEHGPEAGQGGPSASSQQEEGRALLPFGVDAAVDDAAVRQASPGENVASESSGGHRTEGVAARRGHGCHAPSSRVVASQTGAMGWEAPKDYILICLCCYVVCRVQVCRMLKFVVTAVYFYFTFGISYLYKVWRHFGV